MIDATTQPADRLCGLLHGEYPIELPDESLLGKHLLETSLTSPTLGKALPVLNNLTTTAGRSVPDPHRSTHRLSHNFYAAAESRSRPPTRPSS